MKLKKKFFKIIFIQKFLAFIGSLFIKTVAVTSEIKIKNSENIEDLWKNNKPFILAFWHGQLMMISYVWKSNQELSILASGHSDGRFGSYLGKYFNLNNIPVNSKNKSKSLRDALNILQKRKCIGITPDGPRGPNQKASEGAIRISKISKVPIIPLGFASNKNFKLKSWDSFLVTLPFSRCVFYWGEPLIINDNISDFELKDFQNIVEDKINNCINLAKKELDA